MSTQLLNKRLITIFYWPSAQSKRPMGKSVGHISALFSDGTYLSHMLDKSGNSIRMGVRKSIPGSSMIDIPIYRHPSVRYRTFADDERSFGKNANSLILPESFMEINMKEAARSFLLATPPSAPSSHGPLPYYQLADSEEGRGDRSQCATTTAMVISEGLSLEKQDIFKKIRATYKPDDLWDLLNELADSSKSSL